MDTNRFLKLFCEQFDEIDINDVSLDTRFKELDGWNSLVALSVIAMIDEEYDVQLKGNDISSSTTLNDLLSKVVKN